MPSFSISRWFTKPGPDRLFSKICSANVVQFWDEPVAVFRQLRAVLTHNGIIATTYMPRHSGATDEDAHAAAKKVVQQLEQAGFSSTRIAVLKTKPVSTVSVVAVNHEQRH